MTNSGNGEGIYKELLESVLKNTFTPVEWEGFMPYDKLPPRPPLKVHKEVQVDPKLFDGYVGRYVLAPNFIAAVTREGDRLFIEATGEPKAEVCPESERDFFYKVIDVQVTFETGSQGRATRLIVNRNGVDHVAKRIE